ncbi:MAG: phytanoyl-CoA dioxygenase family protein [Gammaproteobacteria bacterium]|nr:phytanoyl-CoA dioxygenase family protein [Gammaproteobacteria bacterium]
MTEQAGQSNPTLIGENALRSDVNQPWERDNQAWWDWYVTLADNSAHPPFTPEDIEPPPTAELPNDEVLSRELRTPYRLTPGDREFFCRNGHIKLHNVLSPGATLRLRQELVRLLSEAFGVALDGGTTERFLSLEMVWLDNPLMREYVLSPRIAKIAADLLDVKRVRLYHDNVLSKEPGCGRTPWHYDEHHFPLATNDVVTAWIPAQPIPKVMGPLAFAMPIETYKLVESLSFNKFDTSYDRKVGDLFRAHNVAVEEGPFALGEVSFHHNLSFHTAAANRTRHSRIVLANTYYVDGARVVEQPTMVSGDWQKFMPGVQPGERAASKLNPVCWPSESNEDD